jgi:MYXO-CTERM domain-containing protein
MAIRSHRGALAAALIACAGPAAALSLGMVDTFEAGANAGWAAGPAIIVAPAVVPGGGPGGASDGYLAVVALGGSGANSRLAVIAGPQWSGDYLAAGVNRITMDVSNLGSTTLNLRLWLQGPLGASAVSSDAVALAAGADWTAVSFALDASALVGQVAATLGNVQQLRLFHATSPAFPGAAVVGKLGLDNVTAVPEPSALWMAVAGLAAIAASRWRRRRT